MPTTAIGAQRSEAVYRVLFVLALAVVSAAIPSVVAIVTGIIAVATVLLFLVDVALQMLMNDMGVMGGGFVTGWLKRLYMWPIDISLWVVLGEGDFPWTP